MAARCEVILARALSASANELVVDSAPDEAMYYVGFHFAEKSGSDGGVGVVLLETLVAKAAKNKLALFGE